MVVRDSQGTHGLSGGKLKNVRVRIPAAVNSNTSHILAFVVSFITALWRKRQAWNLKTISVSSGHDRATYFLLFHICNVGSSLGCSVAVGSSP